MLGSRAETFFLFLGDVCVLYIALAITLVLRYGDSFFDLQRMLMLHLAPFSILFLLWTFVFFVAGLYEKHTLFLQKQLPQLLSRALSVNVLLSVLFFYFIPSFEIAPKINLFIYLFVSSVLLFVWRRQRLSLARNAVRESAALIGTGEEMERIKKEITNNPRYRIAFALSVDTGEKLLPKATDLAQQMRDSNVTLVIVDLHDNAVETLLPHLYELLFSGVRFSDMHQVYEDMFDRIPLSLIRYHWFLEHISAVSSRVAYDFLKRFTDIIVAIALGILSLIFYPFVYLAIKLDDGGKLFVFQRRVGQGGAVMLTVKFRTMSLDDAGLPGLKEGNKVTRVGAFLRRTRIDEFPQLWNVLRGEMSLIGPRPELPSLVEIYEREVPYYTIRHLIKPGLSGWAQLYHKTPPKVDADSDETTTKLSYDLYYLKHRSFWLDIKIALKTIKVLLSRSGV